MKLFRTLAPLCAAASLCAIGALTSSAAAQEKPPVAQYKAGDIVISTPWARATPKSAKVAGGYMKITNTGKQSDRLTGGSFLLSGHIEIHEMAVSDGVMRMRHLPKGLEIKPGETVELRPGGYHVMFMQLREPVMLGQPVKGTLVFEMAGTVEIEYAIAPIGARSLPHAQNHDNHQHGKLPERDHSNH